VNLNDGRVLAKPELRCNATHSHLYKDFMRLILLHCSENSVWLDLQILYLQIIHESYRQVLTPVNNSQLLLKLEILDKLRLVTFLKIQHKETATL
jgi:hypothetical protein